MSDISEILSNFSTEEQKQFISYLKLKNRRGDAKNIALCKLLWQNTPQEQIISSLYKNKSANTYHALKKRLYQAAIDFIATNKLKTENSTEMQLIKYILAARTFLLQDQYKLAFNLLNKAEKLAEQHALHTFVNEVLHTKIQYAPIVAPEQIQKLSKKIEATHQAIMLEDALNIAYAELKTVVGAIEYKGKVVDFYPLVEETFGKLNIAIDSLSFKSLYQVIQITSFSAFVSNNYIETERFLVSTYAAIRKQKQLASSLYYHIAIVYNIANTLFRNKKFTASLKYLKTMQILMEQQKGVHKNKFILKCKLLYTLNKNFTGAYNTAIDTLTPYITKKNFTTEDEYNLALTAIMIFLQQQNTQKAQQLFTKLNHTDKWFENKTGIEWVIKKNLMEIILFMELGHIALVESSLKRFRKSYFPYLKSIQQARVITYVQLISEYYKSPESLHTNLFLNKVENSFEWSNRKEEDIFVMCFYAWLKSKMHKTNVYQTTLELVNNW